MELDDIDDLINFYMDENKEAIEAEFIKPIHPQLNTFYNSLNLYVGRPGSGKTYSCAKEIAKISAVAKDIHMLIYISKSGEPHDPTFEVIKNMIQMPILYVKESEAENTVKHILHMKKLYHQIKSNGYEHKIKDSQLREIMTTLHINNLEQNNLNTLILFEDAANSPLFKRADSYFNGLIKCRRHQDVRATMFILFQAWKNTSPEIKSQADSIVIFPNFSKQQLHYILYQSPVGDFDEIWASYHNLPQYHKLIVSASDGNIKYV